MHVAAHPARRAQRLAPCEHALVAGAGRQFTIDLRGERAAEREVRIAYGHNDPAVLGHQGSQVAEHRPQLGVVLDGAEHAAADHEIEASRRQHLASFMREPQITDPFAWHESVLRLLAALA